MIKIQNEELTNKIKGIFKEYMRERGYEIWKEEDPEFGITYTASKENDKYVPLIELKYGSEFRYKISEYQIRVKDRDGNAGLNGESVASYYLYTKYETEEEKILSEFKKILDVVYNEYGKYSRENRLDFVFNNLEYKTFDYLDKNDNFKYHEWKGFKKKNETV